MTLRIALAVAALSFLPFAAAAEQPTADAVSVTAPGKFAGVFEEKLTSTIESIDKQARSVVLKRANGEQLTLLAGDRVKNFDQLQVGDKVVTRHTQALVLELKKGGAGIRESVESSEQGSAPQGDKPAGFSEKQVAFVADVQKVDVSKGVVTLRGAIRTIRLKINDREQIKLIKAGDQVEGVYAEAVAISVSAAPSKSK